uniref:Uncharacterized protein n=1 Tax=Callithrix jacchus TaxID=9483 RepID=A0A8I3XA49_CALJA
MGSGAGMPKQEKKPRVQEKPNNQKGGPEGTRDAGSAFRPLRDSGGLSPFVPRPGPLQRDLHTQRSKMPSEKKSQPSGMSYCRNSISSSSSSAGGFPWARLTISGPTSLPKVAVTTAATTQPKPVVLHGQQQGTHSLKQPHPSSHPAASAAAQASSSAPTQPAQGTTAPSAAGASLPTTFTWSLAGTLSNPSSDSLIIAMARLTISGPTSLPKVAVTAAATTQPKPVVLHGQQQGTRGLKRAHPYSDPAALA